MRIADVCAFYTPAGGGVRTYVDAKLRAAARFGHEMIVIAPGERHEVIKRGPGAVLVTIPVAAAAGRPPLPLFRRRARASCRCSMRGSPTMSKPRRPGRARRWSGRWQGAASRSLVMHADPLAAYAYRWLGGIAPIARDRPLVRLVLAAPARAWPDVRHGRLRQRPSGRAASRRRHRAMPKRSAWASKPALFSPALRSPAIARGRRFDALGLDAERDAAPRRRPLLGREALGHGDSRGRRERCDTAAGRHAAGRRRAEALRAGAAGRAHPPRRGAARDHRSRRARDA